MLSNRYISITEDSTEESAPGFPALLVIQGSMTVANFAAGSSLLTQTWLSPFVCSKCQSHAEVLLCYQTTFAFAISIGHWSAGADALAWPTNATVSPALSLQLHCLAEPALLKALVEQALPIPSSGLTSSPTPSPQQAGTVRSLCQMLQAVAGVSALCQKALIFTAGPADFVQRLWMSYLKVCI